MNEEQLQAAVRRIAAIGQRMARDTREAIQQTVAKMGGETKP